MKHLIYSIDQLRSNSIKFEQLRAKLKVYLAYKFLVFSVFFMMFSSSCTNEANRQDELTAIETETRAVCSEVTIPLGCIATNFGPLVFNIRGCDHIVSYRVIECASGFSIDNFVWTRGTDGPCQALEATMVSPSGVILNTVFDDVVKELTLAVQDKIIRDYALIVKYRCTNAGSNPCSAATYTVGFSLLGCKALCKEQETGDGGTFYTIYETDCGNACCKRTTPFCIKEDGTFCYGTPVITSVGTCSPDNINCQEGGASACRMPCVKL